VACGATVVAIAYGLVASLPQTDPSTLVSNPGEFISFCEAAFPPPKPAPTGGEGPSKPADGPGVTGRSEGGNRAPDSGDQPSTAPAPGRGAGRDAVAVAEAESLRRKCEAAYREGLAAGAHGQRAATLGHLLRYSLLALVGVAILAAVAGWIVAGRALRPVHRITAAAKAASEQDLSARVALTGPRDELRELADTFDDMLGNLQAAFEGQRRFIANASHELRTPLALMGATVDVVLAKATPTTTELVTMGRDVRGAVDHAETLVEALLTLARSERRPVTRELVDLATVAEDVLDGIRPGDLRVHAVLQPATTTGDPVLLERLAGNLVDNAVRYNVPGGDIRVTTATVHGRATLTVANTGPVIPADAVEGLFQPFRRLDERTGDGFGLGLAIVASITTMHDGTVVAHPAPTGGIEVTVTFLAADEPADLDPAAEPTLPAGAAPAPLSVLRSGAAAQPPPLQSPPTN
jgi:signal transduction histidine kinase